MRALTFIQPWLEAILDGSKTVENRSRSFPKDLIGQTIALHAGVKFDLSDAEWIARKFGLEYHKSPLTQSAILGTARVVSSELLSPTKNPNDPWAFGPYLWRLEDVVRLRGPIPCKGMLGLWTVPDEIALQIEGQL